jgi:hypothetical protein
VNIFLSVYGQVAGLQLAEHLDAEATATVDAKPLDFETWGTTPDDPQWTPITELAVIDSWLMDAERRVAALSTLKRGWDGSDAEPPNLTAIHYAKQVLEALERFGLRPTRIDPSVEEGINISFSRGNQYADIECFNSGAVLAVTSNRRSRPVVWEVETQKENGMGSSVNRIRKFLGS